MSTCVVCGNTIAGEEGITIEKNGETQRFCCQNCLFESDAFDGYKHRSLSSLVLNKTLFEILAMITGFGGVYYTIFEVARRALILDAISVATALAGIFIGVERGTRPDQEGHHLPRHNNDNRLRVTCMALWIKTPINPNTPTPIWVQKMFFGSLKLG